MTNSDEQVVIRYRNVPDYESHEHIFNLYCSPLYLYQMIIIKRLLIQGFRNQFTYASKNFNNELVALDSVRCRTFVSFALMQ